MFKKITLILCLALLSAGLSFAQDLGGLGRYISDKSQISEGGVALFNYQGADYLVAVSPVQVQTSKGTKTEQQCRTVGSAKAKRDMLAYVQGSNISSYTELVFSETATDGLAGHTVQATQQYVEVIRESVMGTINEVNFLCGWYSEDGSLYYYALYKPIK